MIPLKNFIIKYINWILAMIFIFNATVLFFTKKEIWAPIIFLLLALIVGLRGVNKQNTEKRIQEVD